MLATTTNIESFPTSCKVCGGILYEYVDSCPHCGTDIRFSVAAHAGPTTTPRVFRSAPAPTGADPPVAGASAPNHPAVRPDYLHHYSDGVRRPFWHTAKGRYAAGGLLACLVVAIAFATFLLGGEKREKHEGGFPSFRATGASGTEKSSPSAIAINDTGLPRATSDLVTPKVQTDNASPEQHGDKHCRSPSSRHGTACYNRHRRHRH